MIGQNAVTASSVDPNTIVEATSLATGSELLVRKRPPSVVSLSGGHQEHVLMCTQGKPLRGKKVHSKVASDDGVYEWNTCPNWEITFIPAGYRVDWQWTYESESVHLTLKPGYLDHIAEQFRAEGENLPSLQPIFRKPDRLMSELLKRLKDEQDARLLGTDLATSSLLNLIAVNVHRLAMPESEPGPTYRLTDPLSRRCHELLNDRLAQNVSLTELAQEANLSPYHFSRQFKQATGYPPHEYQLRLRIQRAKDILKREPSRSVADIAFSLGFADESHFRRHFKRIVGVTPTQYRR